MSMGFRAESTNTSGVITVAGVDQVVINNAGDVAATTFTGALVGNAATATALSTATGTAPSYGVRAWVNFDGTKDTSGAASAANTNRLIRGSGNVTNVLRNGTGDYSIFFTTAMIDANYATSYTIEPRSPGSQYSQPYVYPGAQATNGVRVFAVSDIDGLIDLVHNNVMVIR
jgi:hypothetical protein